MEFLGWLWRSVGVDYRQKAVQPAEADESRQKGNDDESCPEPEAASATFIIHSQALLAVGVVVIWRGLLAEAEAAEIKLLHRKHLPHRCRYLHNN